MQDDLTRAQHYRSLASQMRHVAKGEDDPTRLNQLLDLARQYERIANKLIGRPKPAKH